MTVHGHFGHTGLSDNAVDSHGVITVLREQIRCRIQYSLAFVFHQILRLTVYGAPTPTTFKVQGILPAPAPPKVSSKIIPPL